MSTQPQTESNDTVRRIRIDVYAQTLFNDTGRPQNRDRRVFGAIRALIEVVETDREQKNSAAAILDRADRAGLISDRDQRFRFLQLVRPAALRRRKLNTDVAPGERKGPPAEAKRKKTERSERDREYRKEHRGGGGGGGNKTVTATNPRTIKKNEKRKARAAAKK